jgi:hypothetical protein
MKIFIPTCDFDNNEYDYQTKYIKKKIYSNEGIFLLKSNKLYKMSIEDKKCSKQKHKDIEFVIDKSCFKQDQLYYYIPYDHVYCEETIETLELGHNILFTKETCNNDSCYYFEYKNNILESNILDEIITFLFKK